MENEPLLPPSSPSAESDVVLGNPSPKAQSWGVVISIVIIMLMIIIGALYAWGKRITQEQALTAPSTTQ